MRYAKIPVILSTEPDPMPDLSFVCLDSCAAEVKQSVFWLAHYISMCMCDVTITPRIASTAAKKLR